MLVFGANAHKTNQILVCQVFELFQFEQDLSINCKVFDVEVFDEHFGSLWDEKSQLVSLTSRLNSYLVETFVWNLRQRLAADLFV